MTPDRAARAASRTRCAASPSTVRTGEEEADRQATDLQDELGFLHTGAARLRRHRASSSARSSSTTRSRSPSRSARASSRCCARSAPRAGRCCARSSLEALRRSASSPRCSGCCGGLLVAPGLQALFKAVGVDLPDDRLGHQVAHDHRRAARRHRRDRRREPRAGAARDAHRADRRAARGPRRAAAAAGRVRTSSRSLLGVARRSRCCSSGCSATRPAAAAAHGPRRRSSIFLGVAMLSPLLVRPLAALVGRPLQRGRRHHRAPRAREHDAQSRPHRGDRRGAHDRRRARRVRGDLRRRSSRLDRALRRPHVPAGDLIVVNQDGFTPISEQAATAVSEVPGVDAVAGVRFASAKVAGRHRHDAGHRHRPGAATRALQGRRGRRAPTATLRRSSATTAWSSTPTAASARAGRSATARAHDADGRAGRRTSSAGLLDEGDFSLLGGGIVVPNDRLVARLQRAAATRSSSSTSPNGANTAQTRAAIDRTLATRFPNAESQTREEFKDEQNAQLDPLLVLIYVLLALSVLVSALRDREHAGAVDVRAHARAGHDARDRHVATAGPQHRAPGGGDHVAHRRGARGRARRALRPAHLAAAGRRGLHARRSRSGRSILLLVLAALFGVLAAIGPARRAARLDVLRALAYE